VLRLISRDKTSKEIAEELGVSPRTIDAHRQNICDKLDLHGSHSLLRFAFDHRAEL
jgi:DNA-binding CsgD family transcriptional regulator